MAIATGRRSVFAALCVAEAAQSGSDDSGISPTNFGTRLQNRGSGMSGKSYELLREYQPLLSTSLTVAEIP